MTIKQIFLGENPKNKLGGLIHKAELKPVPVDGFEDVYKKFYETPLEGYKEKYYITIAKDVQVEEPDKNAPARSYRSKPYRRHLDGTQLSAQFVIYDGDGSLSKPDSCIPIGEAKAALDKLGYNYILYTTHSHNPPDKHRWRAMIPCEMSDRLQLMPTVKRLFTELSALCPDLKWTNESKTWSVPWFTALRDNPDDGLFESYFNNDGIDITAEEPSEDVEEQESSTPTSGPKTTAQLINILQMGHGGRSEFNDALGRYSKQLVDDGVPAGTVIATISAFVDQGTDSTKRQKEALKGSPNEIERWVNNEVKKLNKLKKKEIKMVEQKWTKQEETFRIFTDVPEQGGNAEKLVQFFMSSMRFPNRQIATMSMLASGSTLGGNVYYNETTNAGICMHSQATGRSTIGKEMIMKNFKTLVDTDLQQASLNYIGSGYYKSGRKLVEDAQQYRSLLAILGESGQSDQSKAGDPAGYKATLLKIMVASGPDGYVPKGGQNDSVPALYSPAVTIVKESVAEIQKAADMINQTSLSGEGGRFSYFLIDPVKEKFNWDFKEVKLPAELALVKNKLLKESDNVNRQNVLERRKIASWIPVRMADIPHLKTKFDAWTEMENDYALSQDNFLASTYGRLYEKVPAYASILSLWEDPLKPVVTPEMIDIAEASCIQQLKAFSKQEKSGILDSGWTQIINKVKDVMSGDMTVKKTLLSKSPVDMLSQGACTWSSLSRCLTPYDAYKETKAKDGNFRFHLDQHLAQEGIVRLDKIDSKRQFGTGADVYQRTL